MEVEMEPVYMSPLSSKDGPAAGVPVRGSSHRHRVGSAEDGGVAPEQGDRATEVAQRWNYPPKNVPRIGACFWSFVVMGANDAAYGVSSYLPRYLGIIELGQGY